MDWLRESTHHLEAPVSAPRPQPSLPAQLLQCAGGLLLALVLSLAVLAPPFALSGVAASAALALSDAQQLVVEAWRLVNQSYLDPARFEQVHWRRLRTGCRSTLRRSSSTSRR